MLLVARRARDRGRAGLHRRAVAVRLPRARRGLRVRVLRPGRGGRHGLPAGRPARAAVRRRGDPGRGADDGHPRGQQPARHPDRRGGRQADAGGRPRSACDGRRVRRCCSRSRSSSRSRSRSAGWGVTVLLPLRGRSRSRCRCCGRCATFTSRASSTSCSRGRRGWRWSSGVLFAVGLALGRGVG